MDSVLFYFESALVGKLRNSLALFGWNQSTMVKNNGANYLVFLFQLRHSLRNLIMSGLECLQLWYFMLVQNFFYFDLDQIP